MHLEIEKWRKEIEQNKRNRALEFNKNEEEIKECIKKTCPSPARDGMW